MLVSPTALSFLCCSMSSSMVSFDWGGSCTSDFARSISSPFSSPSSPRVMRPPDISGVAFEIFHFSQRGRIQDVFMPAANEYDGMRWRNRVEIFPIRQPLFFQLRFVPVAVADDHIPWRCVLDPCGHGCKNVRDGAGARQVHAGPAAGIMQMPVRQTRNDCLAFQVDDLRCGACEPTDLRRGTDRKEPPVPDCHCLRDRELRVDGDDVTVDENCVRRCLEARRPAEA